MNALRFLAAVLAMLSSWLFPDADSHEATRATAGAPIYYVDPEHGSDRASGASASEAFRTLEGTLASAPKPPGTLIRLKRGVRHIGALVVPASVNGTAAAPIRIGAYGEGDRPVVTDGDCVVLQGDWIRVVGIAAKDCDESAPGLSSVSGFSVGGEWGDPTEHVSLLGVEASGNEIGVFVASNADRTLVHASLIHDNNRMTTNTPGGHDDNGAVGVDVLGTNTVIRDSTISNHFARSYDYGYDGSAVEIYGSRNTAVVRVRSFNNLTFTEIGACTSSAICSEVTATTFAWNEVQADPRFVEAIYANSDRRARVSFLIQHTGGSGWGRVSGTVAVNNSVRLPGTASDGVVCLDCHRSALKVRNNVIAAGKAGRIDPVNAFTHSHNLVAAAADWATRDGWGDAANDWYLGDAECRTGLEGCADEPRWREPKSGLELAADSWGQGRGRPLSAWPTWTQQPWWTVSIDGVDTAGLASVNLGASQAPRNQ